MWELVLDDLRFQMYRLECLLNLFGRRLLSDAGHASAQPRSPAHRVRWATPTQRTHGQTFLAQGDDQSFPADLDLARQAAGELLHGRRSFPCGLPMLASYRR